MWALIINFPLSIADSQVLLEEFSALVPLGCSSLLKESAGTPSENGCGNRVRNQIAPSSQAWSYTGRGAHSKCHCSSEGTAVEHGSPEALLPLCFACTAEKAVVCCSFLLGASCNISSPRAGWVGAPSSLPSTSARPCCSSRARAAAPRAVASLHWACLRAWANHKVCRVVHLVLKHTSSLSWHIWCDWEWYLWCHF